jgi:hypothetical protein
MPDFSLNVESDYNAPAGLVLLAISTFNGTAYASVVSHYAYRPVPAAKKN